MDRIVGDTAPGAIREGRYGLYAVPDLILPPGDLWVFGYGSLMWRPDFAFARAEPARIHGFHRDLCVRSWVHRGSPERPGLVMGLDRGGSCVGRAYRVRARDKAAVADQLYARELVTPVYLPGLRPVRIAGERTIALSFTVDRSHPQYAGGLSPDEAAAIVRDGVGRSGANPEYLADAVLHLRAMGQPDRRLEAIQKSLARRSAS